MTDVDDLKARAGALKQQLRDVYGIRARDLAHALYKAQRVLPSSARQAGAQMVEGLAMIGHPKLERMVPFEELRAQHELISAHLDQIDVKDIRRGKWLALAGTLAFNLIVITVCFVLWLVLSGNL